MNAVHDYQRLYQQLAEQLPGHEVAWVRRMRETALQRFTALGFPNRKVEAWKYTRLQALEEQLFAPATATTIATTIGKEVLPLASLDAHRLVFVDGHFSRALSDIDLLPSGVLISELSSLLNSSASITKPPTLFNAVGNDADAMRALNNTFISDGAAITVLPGVQIEQPIHLQYVSTAQQNTASYTYNVFIMEPDSRLQIVESHVRLGEGKYVNNVQTDIHLAANAELQHYKLQLEGQAGVHLAATHVEQDRASRYQNHLFAFGAGLMRNELELKLKGEQAECLLNGLFLAQADQHLDMHSQIDHCAPGCISREAYRGIADSNGRGIFDGMVKVHPGAQRSDARVITNNLLLSADAEIDAKPQLEIYADDVKCSHAATIGQLDEEVMFYLRSRGIDAAAARNLMLFAFASHSIELCPQQQIKTLARELLLKQVPDGDQLQELLR